MRLISVIDNVIFLGFIIVPSTFWHRTVFSDLCQHFLEPSLVLVHVHIWYCAYICSYIVLCRYVLYGIVLVLDDFILCNCLQFGFMFVNSQLIQYGCTYGIRLCCCTYCGIALHCTWSSSAWDPRWLTYLSQTNVLLCGQTMVIYLIVYISHTILLKCCVGVQCALNLWPREWIPSEQFWKSHFFIRSFSSTQFSTAL